MSLVPWVSVMFEPWVSVTGPERTVGEPVVAREFTMPVGS
jgi:hypothetical protein